MKNPIDLHKVGRGAFYFSTNYASIHMWLHRSASIQIWQPSRLLRSNLLLFYYEKRCVLVIY
jgi:hypothetical protein